MTNNQQWFDQKYSEKKHKLKNIRVASGGEFEGELIIDSYLSLEKVYLRDFAQIDKIILRNLENLKECNILNCGVKELTIDNCPYIQALNLHNNSLTNFEFVKNLDNLKKLEIDNNKNIDNGLEWLPESLKAFSYKNTKLTELLKPYHGDWKAYQKDLQELIGLAKKKPQQLLQNIQSLKAENKKLKEQQLVALDNPKDFEYKYQQLKKFLNLLVNEEQLKTEEVRILKTEDLTNKLSEQKANLTQTEQEVEQKAKELNELQKINHKLKSKLDFFETIYQTTKKRIADKKKELELLKESLLTKTSGYNKQKLEKKLAKLLRFQADIVNFNSPSLLAEKEEIKESLVKKALLTTEELGQLCSLQAEITHLEQKLQKNFNYQQGKFQQIINKHYHIIQSIVAQSSHIGGDFNPQANIAEEAVAEELANEILVSVENFYPH